MDDLLPSVKELGTGHDWNQGRDLFKKAACRCAIRSDPNRKGADWRRISQVSAKHLRANSSCSLFSMRRERSP